MKRTYHNNISFLDILFNFLLATVILLVIAVLHIVEDQNKANIETKAEFVITLEWDTDQDNDVDIWVEDPNEIMMWYRTLEAGVVHNDRDDKGSRDDIYIDGEVLKINQEIVTWRGIVEGEWVVNLHMYRMGGTDRDKEGSKVKITMMKLNPKASIIFKKEYFMKTHWEQITVARFHMTKQGEIMNLTDEPWKDLIMDRVFAPVIYNPDLHLGGD